MKATAVVALAAALAVSGLCAARAADAPVRSQFHHGYPLAGNGAVSIDDDSGDVRVVGWGAPRVQIDATLCAPSPRELANMRVSVDSSPSTISVQTLFPRASFSDWSWWQQLFADDGCGNGMEVDYVVHVPIHARVSVSTRSGDIDARGLQAALNARSTSGDVLAQDVGDASLSTVSGNVTVRREHGVCDVDDTSGHAVIQAVTGSLTMSSVSGDVRLEQVTGKAVVSTTSGDITAVAYRGVARLHSTSGDIDLTLVRGGGVSLSASTVSGDIESDVPLRTQAPVDAQTVSGSISAHFI